MPITACTGSSPATSTEGSSLREDGMRESLGEKIG
jgi:hypothetical protein